MLTPRPGPAPHTHTGIGHPQSASQAWHIQRPSQEKTKKKRNQSQQKDPASKAVHGGAGRGRTHCSPAQVGPAPPFPPRPPERARPSWPHRFPPREEVQAHKAALDGSCGSGERQGRSGSPHCQAAGGACPDLVPTRPPLLGWAIHDFIWGRLFMAAASPHSRSALSPG